MARKSNKVADFKSYRNNGNKIYEEDYDEEIDANDNKKLSEKDRVIRDIKNNKSVHNEIYLVIGGLITLLLYMSIFNLCGVIGIPIKGIIFFLFGFFGYFLPATFMGIVVYVLYNTRKNIAYSEVFLSSAGIICICALLHVVSGSTFKSLSFVKANGGGFIGFLLGGLLRTLCGYLAALIILIVAILVIAMILTGKAILSIFYEKNKQVYKKTSEKIKQNRERKAQAELDRKAEYGREYYNRMMDGENVVGPKIYGGDNSDGPVRTTPKRETFVDKLKRGGAEIRGEGYAYDSNKEEDVIRVHQISEHEYTPNPDMDMMEIVSDHNTTENVSSESIYEQELRKKFGNKEYSEAFEDENIKPAIIEYSGGDVTNTREEEYVPSIRGNVINDDMASANSSNNSTNIAGTLNSSGNFGMTEESRTAGKSGNAFVFARGDVKTISPSGPSVVSENVKREQAKEATKSEPGAPRRIPIPKRTASLPPMTLLKKPVGGSVGTSKKELMENGKKLQDVLKSFGVNVTVTDICCGPSVIRYELQPEVGVKVSKITSLADDIKLNLAAQDIRIEAPIPGKAAVGIEVPNKNKQTVYLHSLFMSDEFKNSKGKLPFAVGKDITGNVIIGDLAKMPHMLIAGTTGSGKSVFVNSIIFSILYKQKPEECKLIMIDPKMVEFPIYNGIPHLLIPVVTDPKKASAALNWAVMEMTDRYNKFASMQVRDISSYNAKIDTMNESDNSNDGMMYERLPQIVIIIDELADLMMVASNEVDDAICRLAQLARAAGIHMIIATQRPSVNVVTGTIKANIPSRVALSLSSQIDSRTIIDMAGAEKLLGNGDMLYYPTGYTKPLRIQGAYVSDEERENLVEFLKRYSNDSYNSEIIEKIETAQNASNNNASSAEQTSAGGNSMYDEYIYQAGIFIIEKEKASIGMLQRQFKIGFNRAARIMDQLCDLGAVGPEEGTKPRQILMNLAQFEQLSENENLKG